MDLRISFTDKSKDILEGILEGILDEKLLIDYPNDRLFILDPAVKNIDEVAGQL
ncbi:MAG: hypothetical protein GY786_14285 [Proteobacteria bacterium]|nr:hypothetical protein [Pseudomonadota bacterium]